MAEAAQGGTAARLADWGRRRWWIFSTYYAEGFPTSLVRLTSTAYFKEHGASLQATGLTSLFSIPLAIKFLWAPLVDSFATKRRWLVMVEAVVVGGIVLLGVASAMPRPLVVGSAVFMLLGFLAATHDIAIDGYYLEALDRTEQARYVGVQSAAYRLALIAAGGGVLWLCGRVSWPLGYLAAAMVLGTLWLLHATSLPRIEQPKRPLSELGRYLARPRTLLVVAAVAAVVLGLRELLQAPAVAPVTERLGRVSAPSWVVIALFAALAVVAIRAPSLKRRLYGSDSPYALAFVDYLDRPRIGVILAFIVTFRIGEALLQNMAYPFLRDIGITVEQYGLAHNTFGVIATVTGTMAGGALIARFGLRRCIWPFVLAPNTLHFLYMFLAVKYQAIFQRPELGRADFTLVCVLVGVEALATGFANAAFSVFIQRTTKASHKAAHFAIGSGLMNVAGIMAGVVSGFIAVRVGFAWYFGFTFVAAIPNLLLIPFLPLLDGPPKEGAQQPGPGVRGR